MSNTSKMKFKVGDRVRYDSGDPYFVDTGVIMKINEDMFLNGAYHIHWDKYPDDNGWYSDGNLTLITELKIPTPKFKVGDKVGYRYLNTEYTWVGTVVEVCVDKFKYSNSIENGYRIDYVYKGVSKNSGWMTDPNLTLIVEPTVKSAETSPTVKSAVEAKVELEKKILEQIQEYNKTYGVNVSDINIRQYSGIQYIDESRDSARYLQNISVDIEVRL